MKQVFGIFAALILVPSMQSQAWIGGPWGNDSYQSNGDDGIYEAVGTLTDGTAMYRWAVNNENPGGVAMVGGQANAAQTSNVDFGGLIGAASPHVIWYRGLVYYGRCFGIVNSHMKTVMVTGNASTQGLNGSLGQLNGVDLTTGDASALNFQVARAASATLSNRKTVANSTWKGKITSKYPMKRFHGWGTISFIGQPDFELIVVAVDPLFNFFGSSVEVVTQTIDSTSSSSQFLPEGHKVGMRVFGNQVSLQVND